MSAVLDEETTTVLLEELEFDPTCDVVQPSTCAEHAEYQTTCVGCGGFCGLLCVAHALMASHSMRKMRHIDCGLTGPMCLIVTVVPL